MSMQRWHPVQEMVSLREAMGRLLEESVVSPLSFGGVGLGPALDLEESPEEYTVRAALPGFRPEDVDVSVLGDTLTIRAERQEEQERQDRNYLLREHRAGAVSRTITLPGLVDVDKVQARHEHGELILTLPKSAESKPRRIPIGGGGERQLAGGQAYQYGYDAGRSDRYRGHEFEAAEADLRGEYERREQDAGHGIAGLWDRLREEIRSGWQRARGR